MKKVFVLYFLLHVLFSYSQSNIDSLFAVYKNEGEVDTNRLNALDIIVRNTRDNYPDTAIILANEELRLAAGIKEKRGDMWQGKALSSLSRAYMNTGDFQKAIEYDLKSLKVFEELHYAKGISNAYLMLGIVYANQAAYTKALENYLIALKMNEEMKNNAGIGQCCVNISTLYYRLDNFKEALQYSSRGLEIFERSNDLRNVASCYASIGNCYYSMRQFDKALDFFLRSLKIAESIKEKRIICANYNNLGNLYADLHNGPEAMKYYYKVLVLYKEMNDKNNIGTCYLNLGALYMDMKRNSLAVKFLDSALTISKEVEDLDNERIAYGDLAKVYSKMGLYKEAYENNVLYKQITDSIFNEENSKQLGDLKTQFEVEKKESELKIKAAAENEKFRAIASEEKKRQTVVIFAVGGILFVVLCFSFFLLQRIRLARKQKSIIEKQKEQVDNAYAQLHEKNKEVVDSIMYARRIQQALLPTENYLKKYFNK